MSEEPFKGVVRLTKIELQVVLACLYQFSATEDRDWLSGQDKLALDRAERKLSEALHENDR